MEFKELREQHRHFYYHSFDIEPSETEITLRFHFEIEGLSVFTPTMKVPYTKEQEPVISTALFKNAVFSIGMIELISYWKISCAPDVIVECGSLDEKQISWWKKLYFNGLGEFFYINHIETDISEFMHMESNGSPIEGTAYDLVPKGNLIPVGGGKDSFVTLDLLKGSHENNHAFIINPLPSAVASAAAAGYEGERCIILKRTLDQNMLELNKKGYLNGHTPFSALAAFAAYMTAVLYGKKYITLSNESSANESTIKDSSVNHQYSKSFEFEQDFQTYTAEYLNPEIRYFSLLRPISELQIAGLFSMLKPYHRIFRSCNVGSKQGIWCGHCAKCLFVCILLSAYLEPEEIKEIFGRDMLNDAEMTTLFEQLTGILDDKPFECVGTRDEVNLAICMCIRHLQESGREIPLLYQNYMNTKYYSFYQNQKLDMNAYQDENLLPEEYASILKGRLAEYK